MPNRHVHGRPNAVEGLGGANVLDVPCAERCPTAPSKYLLETSVAAAREGAGIVSWTAIPDGPDVVLEHGYPTFPDPPNVGSCL